MQNLYNFLLIREIPEKFFEDPDILFINSLLAKAWEHIELKLRKDPRVPLTDWEMELEFRKYLVRVEVRERMLMLLPFHHTLFRLLDQDPFSLTLKDLKKLAKESKKKIKNNPDDYDSWLLLASSYAFRGLLNES